MSKLGFTALMVGLGILLFKILVGTAKLLYLLCKIAVLIPIALFALVMGNLQVSVSRTPPATAPLPATGDAAPEPGKPAPAPDLGPATIESTGDWRQDRETLKQLLAEGKIK